MRNLTIKRTKSFVGCLVKIKIHIEDPASNEIMINNTACRKIGELKNGEEKTFQIEEHAAKVFVIVDQLSKNYCNEFYQLPEGQEDISLSGRNKFNLATGNAFRFDNNESEETAANRKRGTRKGLLVLIAAIIVGGIAGYSITSNLFSNKTPKAKTFSSDGMIITLTDEFKKTSFEDYTVAYESKNIAIIALKEEFTLAEGFGDCTLDQYAELVLQASQLTAVEVRTVDGLVGFTYDYTDPETKTALRYFTYVFKTDDAFWTVQFATAKKNADAYASEIKEWAKSIMFSK